MVAGRQRGFPLFIKRGEGGGGGGGGPSKKGVTWGGPKILLERVVL